MKLNCELEHVNDPKQFAQPGVRITPGVVVNGKVLFSGKVPTFEELKTALKQIAG